MKLAQWPPSPEEESVSDGPCFFKGETHLKISADSLMVFRKDKK